MGVIRIIALTVLGISVLVFITLFGRLPAFRKTPIAFLHRVVWVHIPNGVAFLDSHLFGGHIVRVWNRSGSYMWNENHPVILIFFVGLLAIGEAVFLPPAWPRMSGAHKPWVPVVVTLPYLLLYKCVTTKSFITSENHDQEMKRYPKHCNICKGCVARHDHHCVWLMNCVGANNYVYFMSLLLSLTILLVYGTFIGYQLLCQTLETRVTVEGKAAMKGWTMYFHIWALVITADYKIGTVTLLMLMTAPLAAAFLIYHSYLVWAGTTTNESAKWSDLKDDVEDGFVFKAKRTQIENAPPYTDFGDEPWPVQSDQILVTDEDPPMEGFILEGDSNRVHYNRTGEVPIDSRWRLVQSMNELDNIYDIGFWDNFKDAMGMPDSNLRNFRYWDFQTPLNGA
ncbi:hypothetical protein N7494_012184 [Penicillium frequentans]|uniref:Palmitoyltransferase n=1 Tax=Penicillium frequentans TaxID=3151616 RepID=A0AAD6CL86_9EURO|nr:hypothetical protein N7494_012184 [Penicillium glabrum]